MYIIHSWGCNTVVHTSLEFFALFWIVAFTRCTRCRTSKLSHVSKSDRQAIVCYENSGCEVEACKVKRKTNICFTTDSDWTFLGRIPLTIDARDIPTHDRPDTVLVIVDQGLLMVVRGT